MTATLTDISKHNAVVTDVTKPREGGMVFYAWLFWFTITNYQVVLVDVAKHAATVTDISKN